MRIHPKSSQAKKSRHKLLFLAQVALLPLLSMKAMAGVPSMEMPSFGNHPAYAQSSAFPEPTAPPYYESNDLSSSYEPSAPSLYPSLEGLNSSFDQNPPYNPYYNPSIHSPGPSSYEPSAPPLPPSMDGINSFFDQNPPYNPYYNPSGAQDDAPPSYDQSQEDYGYGKKQSSSTGLNQVSEPSIAHQLKQKVLEKANEHNMFNAMSWGAAGAKNATSGASLLGTALGDISEFLSFIPTLITPPKSTDALSANYFAKNYPNTFTYSPYRAFHAFWAVTALGRAALNTVGGLAQMGLGTLDLGAGGVVGGAKGLMAAPGVVKGAARTAKSAAEKVVDTAHSAANSTKSAAQWAYEHKAPILGVALPIATMAALAYTNPEEFQKIKGSLLSSLTDAYNATTPHIAQAASAAGSLAGEALSGAKSAAGSALSGAGSFAKEGIVSAAKTAAPYLVEGGKIALRNGTSLVGKLANIGSQTLLEAGRLSLRIATEMASKAMK
jgi:hypothetical protein